MSRSVAVGHCFLGVDVGGTNIKVGVVTETGQPLAHTNLSTKSQSGPDGAVTAIAQASREAIANSPVSWDDIRAVGLATPGTMDIPAGVLLEPPNLPGWENYPIRQRVEDALQKPTYLQNDANAAAYGEYWVGAARDASSLVFWTLGTGVGCGIIVQDQIIQGEHSHGGECGHIIIEMDNGRYCDTGQYGTLEAYASAKSLVRRCEEALAAGRRSKLTEWLEQGEELTPVLIARAEAAGDTLADELLMETARYLGVGTTTLMHTIDPAMVLFGGGMTFGRHETALGRRFLARIREEVRTRAFPIPCQKTIIDYATLGGDAGYIGAAGYARLQTGRA